jgi:hypothetical protein
MRDPRVTTEAHAAAVAEAVELLRPLTKPGYPWSIVNWNQIEDEQGNDRRISRRDLHDAAVEFVIALLDPDTPKPERSKQPETGVETYDGGVQRRVADALLGVIAPAEWLGPIVRKVILPALRLPPPPKRKGKRAPKRKGPPPGILAKRWIAAVVTTICEEYELDPYRNPLSEHTHNGCAVIAEALKQLEIGLAERSVERIYMKRRQA